MFFTLSLQVEILEILVAIISGNRYSHVLNPLLTDRDIGRNNLRGTDTHRFLTLSLQVEILIGIISGNGNRYSQALNPILTGRDIGRNNLREQILTGS